MIKGFIKKSEIYSSIVSVLMIILSIFLICRPLKSIVALIISFGIILIVNGIGGLITYFTTKKEDRLFSFDLILGLFTMLAGILILVYRIELLPVFPVVLGIYIIVNNLFKLQFAVNLSSVKNSGWIWLVVMAVLTIILGVLLIVKPFSSTIALTTIAGIFLLVTEVINLFESIYIIFKIKKM